MPTPTTTLSVMVLPAVREELRRLSLVERRSQAKIIERLVLSAARFYTADFTPAERARYELSHMTHLEFLETQIRRRSSMKAPDGADAQPGRSDRDGQSPSGAAAPGAAANANAPASKEDAA